MYMLFFIMALVCTSMILVQPILDYMYWFHCVHSTMIYFYCVANIGLSFCFLVPNNTHTVFVNNNQVGVTQGGNLTDLMCTVTLQQNIVNSLMGSFIRISWSPNTIPDLNTRVVSPSTSISELFTITSVSIAYAGEYKCSAEIFYNDTNSDYVTIPQQPIPEDAINIQVKGEKFPQSSFHLL